MNRATLLDRKATEIAGSHSTDRLVAMDANRFDLSDRGVQVIYYRPAAMELALSPRSGFASAVEGHWLGRRHLASMNSSMQAVGNLRIAGEEVDCNAIVVIGIRTAD